MIETKVKELRKKYGKVKVVIYKGLDKVPYSKYKSISYFSVFVNTEENPVKVIFEVWSSYEFINWNAWLHERIR